MEIKSVRQYYFRFDIKYCITRQPVDFRLIMSSRQAFMRHISA